MTTHADELSDKVDQLMFIGFSGQTIGSKSDIQKILSTTNIGGVIIADYDPDTHVYRRNIKSPTQLQALIKQLQTKAKTPLYIGIDEEGGLVSRLNPKYGFNAYKSATDIGKGTHQDAQTEYEKMADELASLGINLDFGPVVDLANKPTYPLTKDKRVYSSDPTTVADFAETMMSALHDKNIATVAKHYPGLGDVSTNTHRALAIHTGDNSKNLEPYKILSQKNLLQAVMVGHVKDTAVDALYPASLSKKHIDLLRTNISFDGLVITDDLQMGAIAQSYTPQQAAVKALQAGSDMVLFSGNISPTLFIKIRTSIISALKKGTLSQARIDEAYGRVIKAKKQFQIITQP